MSDLIILKKLVFLLIFMAAGVISPAQGVIRGDASEIPPHPRLLLLENEEEQIRQSIATSAEWRKMHEAIVHSCDLMIDLPPVERIQIGRRLLDKSREALRRIFQLSYAWRITGEEKYFRRAEKEMLAVSRFTDWNPSHFLDVAEMTMAVAIGYDWLFPKLSDATRNTVRNAILTKGIYPSLDPKYSSWLGSTNNWNQVCNAGMTYGVLAVYEDHPELAAKTIERALNSIPLAMGEYSPDGAYPEGYSYWGYGTSFNVMLLSAIEKIYGTDFGLNSAPGFLSTAGFYQNMTGVTGLVFNWGDCGQGGGVSPAMFWLAQKNNNPSQLWIEKSFLQKDDYSEFTGNRLLPAIMIWGKELPANKIKTPESLFWRGQGANPVCLMRTSWSDRNAIFLGFKAGSPSVNHGHMDIGSFVMEADGSRWATDFGMQDYESLESKGIQVFGRTQDAQRWSIFRINNMAHNTLTINDQLQLVKGYAKIDKYSDRPEFMYAISDLSSVYENQLASVTRGVAIVNKQFVVIRDELAATSQAATIRWTMLTSATPEIKGNKVTLRKEGHSLEVIASSPSGISMKTWSAEPSTSYDAPNPGKIFIGFEMKLKPGEKQSVQVLLIPGSASKSKPKFKRPLNSW